jgi:hypothetical protein
VQPAHKDLPDQPVLMAQMVPMVQPAHKGLPVLMVFPFYMVQALHQTH